MKACAVNRRTALLLIGSVILVAAGILAAAILGAKAVPLKTVWDSLFHYKEELDLMLVRDSRLPRALCSVLVGGLLAMTGAVMQGITRNVIAEPSIMGVTQGATLAVAIASVHASVYGLMGNTLAALSGAFFSGLLVLLFSMQSTSNMSLARLLMAGTAISTFFLSLASLVALLGNRSQDLAFWVSGGFRTVGWKHVWMLLVVGGICTVLAILLAHKINIVSLGDDVAVGLGAFDPHLRRMCCHGGQYCFCWAYRSPYCAPIARERLPPPDPPFFCRRGSIAGMGRYCGKNGELAL